jgi:hypothetical protein
VPLSGYGAQEAGSPLAQHGVRQYKPSQCLSQALELMPLVFAQQLRFFASMQYWDAARRVWGADLLGCATLGSAGVYRQARGGGV